MAMSSVFSGFLDLPPRIRHRIYVGAGLVVNSELDLSLNSKEKGHGEDRPDYSPSRTLMLVCRIVHTETSILFYSTNRFVIRFHRAGDLRAIRLLQPKMLLAFTCLTVQLNLSNGSRHVPVNCPKSNDELLQAHSSSAKVLLSEWEATANYLSRHIKPGALDFGLVCDVADVETAQLVVAPLYRWPTVAACHIRLGPSRRVNIGLQRIARDVGLHAEGRGNTFSGYLSLPTELRLRILEYTDLVSPLSRVSWFFGQGPHAGYRLVYMGECMIKKAYCEPPYDICHPNNHQQCTINQCLSGTDYECLHYASGWKDNSFGLFRCWTCSHYVCQFRRCWLVNKRSAHQGHFCFCPRYHAAYTPFCQCWAPPTPMFLVSRAFRRDAQQVFFGKNHFDISLLSSDYLLRLEPRPARYAESVFLNNLVPASALQYLRSLEFRFLVHDRLPFTISPETAVEDQLAGYPAMQYLRSLEFRFPNPDWLPLASHQSQEAAEKELTELQDWQRTVDRVISSDDLSQALSSPSLLLRISVSWVAGLDTWEDYCSRGEIPLDKSNSAIDTLQAAVASFWPPLLQGHSQVLYAFIDTNWMQAGYFIRPGRQQEGRSIHEPPEFALDWDQADFTVERTVKAGPRSSLDTAVEVETGGSTSVEGIYVTFQCML